MFDFIGELLSPSVPKKLLNKTKPKSWTRALLTVLWDLSLLIIFLIGIYLFYSFVK